MVNAFYFVKDVKTGEVMTKEHIRSIRPGYGLPPKFYTQLLGMRAATDNKRGTPVSWDKVSK